MAEPERIREEDATLLVEGGVEGDAFSGESIPRRIKFIDSIRKHGFSISHGGSGSVIPNSESRGVCVLISVVGNGDRTQGATQICPRKPGSMKSVIAG